MLWNHHSLSLTHTHTCSGSTILDFMLHAFHEGVREIAMWREHKYASASLHVSHGSKTSSDKPDNHVVEDNLWTRWELAFEYLG
jgi:hypothetical protein